MYVSVRRAITTVLATCVLLAAGASTAAALPPIDDDPLDCATKVSGTISASPVTVDSGAPTTISWSVSQPALCAGEVTYRVGTSILSPVVNTSGSKVYRPVIRTTYRLYADFGSHYRVLASRTVAINGEIPVVVDINTFKAVQAQETGLFSNGDEPWLMVIPIFGDGRTVDFGSMETASARVYSSQRAHGNLNRTGVRSGTTVSIPADTGKFTTTMQPVRGLPMGWGKRTATVGVLVVALEQDGTPGSAADAGRVTARTEIQNHVTALLRELERLTDEEVAKLQGEISAEVVQTMMMETLLAHSGTGIVDPDDFIGAGFTWATQEQIEGAPFTGVPVNIALEGEDGTSYVVTGTVRRG